MLAALARFVPGCARASAADEDEEGDGETKKNPTDDDSDVDADDPTDARDAVELYAAYERRMLERAHSSSTAGRVLAASTRTSEGETAMRGRRAVDASDTGAVEIALRRLRSEQFLRAAERREREARERDGEKALVRETDIMGMKKKQKKETLVRERFAATLYAKMEGKGKQRWASLGRRMCEPSVDAEGALVPLFRDEEMRRTNVARAMFCAPKWTAPKGCDALKTVFHLVLETLPAAVERDVVTEDDVRKKIANEKDELANAKGKLFADLKFTLMDLCAGPERRLEAEARAQPRANARSDARGALRAECVLQLTPFDFSRPPQSARGRQRDATAPDVMSFEELFDQYEDALVDANAVVGVEHYRQRKERIKSALRAKSFIDPSTQILHRLVAVDDSTTFDDVASARRRSKSNRAVGARAGRPRARQTPPTPS